MPDIYEIEKDGEIYEVEAASPEAAVAALSSLGQPQKPQAPPPPNKTIGLQWRPEHAALGKQIEAADMGGSNPMAMFPAGKTLAAAKAVPGVVARGLGISKARAGQNIDAALTAAKDARVPMEKAAPIINRAKELGATGHNRSQVIHKLEMAVKKAQDGSLSPREAQDFVSSASRMSSAEGSRISPAMHRQVAELAATLRQLLTETVETAAGKGAQYASGVKEYRRAAKTANFAKKAGKAALGATGLGGYYALFGD